jgi:two-component system OmpR family sensor kinase
LRNLVENALRHGPADGAVTITVATGMRYARLAVSDTGAGLTPAEAERAFARFWRGSGAAPGGSGLGLAIVRSTAERHGGRVTVEGATFTLELPLAARAGAPPLRELSKSGGTTWAHSNEKGRR